MSRSYHFSIGHEQPPILKEGKYINCPVCGSEFRYLGGYCHGSTPVCSYKCQRVLEREYQQTNEYKNIQTELGNRVVVKSRNRELPSVLPDGPLNRDQLQTLHNMMPKTPLTHFQQTADMLLKGMKGYDIYKVNGASDNVLAWVRRVMGKAVRNKFSAAQKREIAQRHKAGELIINLANEYGVTRETIRRVLKHDSSQDHAF